MLKTLVLQVFKKSGVEKFDPTSEPFDPHKHYAVFQIPDGSKTDGTVAVVLKVLVPICYSAYSHKNKCILVHMPSKIHLIKLEGNCRLD